MTLEHFLADLDMLRADLGLLPRIDVSLRYRRRFLYDGPPGLAGVAMALMEASEPAEALLDRSELTVFLYRSGAPSGSKPFIAFPVDPMAHIEATVSDGSPGVAIGWPALGRAAVVQVADVLLWPAGPGTSYLFSPRLE